MKLVIQPLRMALSPEQVFEKISSFPPCFWLDSSLEHSRYGTWSYLGFLPFLSLRFRKGRFFIFGEEERVVETFKPLKLLRQYFSRYQFFDGAGEFPFFSGGVGYFSYELGNYFERIPFTREDDLGLDELRLDFYQFILGYHHPEQKWYLLGLEGEEFPEKQNDFLDKLWRALEQKREGSEEFFSEQVQSVIDYSSYCRAVQRAREYIIKGDIYQVNFTQRFYARYLGDAFSLYSRLRRFNPGAYAGVLLYPDFGVLSSSPELFLRVRGREIITRPIKGTRARGKTQEEDEKIKKELLESEKDLAELAMIVDLERNDLGRVCDYGSVEVLGYPELESYSRVHHLVATVRGELAEGRDIFDLIRASFPGGSITGAPKIRAMEIIDELEPVVRGVYTGSIGWLGFNQNLELNIAIRVIILKDGFAYFPAGGGIVYDSDPELEYEESWVKALALWEALSKKFQP